MIPQDIEVTNSAKRFSKRNISFSFIHVYYYVYYVTMSITRVSEPARFGMAPAPSQVTIIKGLCLQGLSKGWLRLRIQLNVMISL